MRPALFTISNANCPFIFTYTVDHSYKNKKRNRYFIYTPLGLYYVYYGTRNVYTLHFSLFILLMEFIYIYGLTNQKLK